MNHNFLLIIDFIKIFGTVISIILAFIAVNISIWIYKSKKKDSKTTKTMTCLTDLFPYYKEAMKNINKAFKESKNLEKYLNNCKLKEDFSKFNKEYYSEKYDCLREVHYFFELLGTIIRKNEIDRSTAWYYFIFPIEYFIETKNIRDDIMNYFCLPSYGENFCWLFKFYNDFRNKYNKKWFINGEEISFNDKEAKEYYKNFNFNEYE